MRVGYDSAFGPTSAQLAHAILNGVTWWGWYVGGPGAYHAWTDTEVAVLAAAGLGFSLPIWVPAMDLSGDPALDYRAARARARSLGWAGPVALDTEARMRGLALLHPYVDGWDRAAIGAGDLDDIYAGGNYPGTANPWWIIPGGGAPPARTCWQVSTTSLDGLDVDVDHAADDYPLATPIPQGGAMPAYGPDGASQTDADLDQRRATLRVWWHQYRGGEFSVAQQYELMLFWAAHGADLTLAGILDNTLAPSPAGAH